MKIKLKDLYWTKKRDERAEQVRPSNLISLKYTKVDLYWTKKRDERATYLIGQNFENFFFPVYILGLYWLYDSYILSF